MSSVVKKVLLHPHESEGRYCCGCYARLTGPAVIVGEFEHYDAILCEGCLMSAAALLPSVEG